MMLQTSTSYFHQDDSVLSKKVFDNLIDLQWSIYIVTPLKDFCTDKLYEYQMEFEKIFEKNYSNSNVLVKMECTFSQLEFTALEIKAREIGNEKISAQLILLSTTDNSNKYNKCLRQFKHLSSCTNLPLMLTSGNSSLVAVAVDCLRTLFGSWIFPYSLTNTNLKQILNIFTLRSGKAKSVALKFNSSKHNGKITIEIPIRYVTKFLYKLIVNRNRVDVDETSSGLVDFLFKAVETNCSIKLDESFELCSLSLPCLKIHSENKFTVHDSTTAFDFCGFLLKYAVSAYAFD